MSTIDITPHFRHDGYAPSLAIVRNFEGKYWVLRMKVTYNFSQNSNGRQSSTAIVFKTTNTGEGRKVTQLRLWRDDDLDASRDNFSIQFLDDGNVLGDYGRNMRGLEPDTWYIEVIRKEATLSVRASQDGQNWFEPFPPINMTSNPPDQTIALEANSWLAVTNSYADYDYIYVDQLVVPVEYRYGPPFPGYKWLSRTYLRSWLQVRFENKGPGEARNVTATITGKPANVTILDGFVSLGNIPAGGSAWSNDTYTIDVDTSNPQDPRQGIFWRVEYDDAAGVHHVVENVPQK